MIKIIPYEGRHKIQTRFGILNYFYLPRELNMISSIDQKNSSSSFVRVSSKLIFLYAVVAKIGEGNNIIVHRNCKKMYTH